MKSVFQRSLVATLAMGAIVTAAFAGAVSREQVVIDDSRSSASGNLGYVRKTADSVQYIGCSVMRSTETASCSSSGM